MEGSIEQIAKLPVLAQLIVYCLVGIGAIFILGRSYLKGWAKPELKPNDLLLSAGTITDMKPIRDLVDAVVMLVGKNERIAVASEKIAAIHQIRLDQRKTEMEIEREVKRRLKDHMDDDRR